MVKSYSVLFNYSNVHKIEGIIITVITTKYKINEA